MRHIVRAIILLIILYVAAQYFQDSPGILGLIYVLCAFVFMYLIAGIIGAITNAVMARRRLTAPAPAEAKDGPGGVWLFLIILFVVLTFVFNEALGNFSFKVFLFLDNLVKISDSASPLLLWGMLGLMIGAIYGSFVAWKKYKLDLTVNFIPVGIVLLFIAILFKVNHPLETNTFGVSTSNLQTDYAYDIVTATAYNTTQDNNANDPSLLLD